MRQIRVYKPPTGIAVFEVKHDRAVTFIDLMLIGAHLAKNIDPVKYSKQYGVVYSTLNGLGFKLDDFNLKEEFIIKYKGRVVLCSAFLEEKTIIKIMVFASLSPGILQKLAKKLMQVGWRQKTLIELKPATSVHA